MVQYIKNNEEHYFHRKFTGPGRSAAHSTLCDSCKKHSVGPQDSLEAVSQGLCHRIRCSQPQVIHTRGKQLAAFQWLAQSTPEHGYLLPTHTTASCWHSAWLREGKGSEAHILGATSNNPTLPEGWTQNKSPNHDQKVSTTAGIKQNIKLSIF